MGGFFVFRAFIGDLMFAPIDKKVGGSVLISDLLIGTATALISATGFPASLETSYFHKLAISVCFPLGLLGVLLYQKNNIFSEFLGRLLVKFSVSLFGFLFTLVFFLNFKT